MTTQLAINYRAALQILIDRGVVDNDNINEVYKRLCAEVKQPTTGYWYVNDVCKFADKLECGK